MSWSPVDWGDCSLLVLDIDLVRDSGIRYARNQRVGLSQFLDDGRLPIHNNLSELALRREAVGRKNGHAGVSVRDIMRSGGASPPARDGAAVRSM